MSFVDQYSAILFHDVCVRCASSSAHQNYACAIAQPEVHTALEAYSFLLAHLDV